MIYNDLSHGIGTAPSAQALYQRPDVACFDLTFRLRNVSSALIPSPIASLIK
jgi:hypothetical protein